MFPIKASWTWMGSKGAVGDLGDVDGGLEDQEVDHRILSAKSRAQSQGRQDGGAGAHNRRVALAQKVAEGTAVAAPREMWRSRIQVLLQVQPHM